MWIKTVKELSYNFTVKLVCIDQTFYIELVRDVRR